MSDKEISEVDLLDQLDLTGFQEGGKTDDGMKFNCDFGMHGLHIAEAVIALAPKRKAIELISKKKQKEMTAEQIAEAKKQDVAIINTKTIKMAANKTAEQLISRFPKKQTWTREEYDKLTVTIKGNKVRVGIYRTIDGVISVPGKLDSRDKQVLSKLKRIISDKGGKLSGSVGVINV
ncbi:MAG: hypothetical protein HKP62_01465 [Sulfurovum sp.]|nr:hypothetical protein [Sulfurovum sp.]NNJ44663.1 hypothetical protein [Sulfurovum sp.]